MVEAPHCQTFWADDGGRGLGGGAAAQEPPLLVGGSSSAPHHARPWFSGALFVFGGPEYPRSSHKPCHHPQLPVRQATMYLVPPSDAPSHIVPSTRSVHALTLMVLRNSPGYWRLSDLSEHQTLDVPDPLKQGPPHHPEATTLGGRVLTHKAVRVALLQVHDVAGLQSG